MDVLATALGDDDTHRHPDADRGRFDVDHVGQDLRPFDQRDDGDDIRQQAVEVGVIGFVEDDEAAHVAVAGRAHPAHRVRAGLAR